MKTTKTIFAIDSHTMGEPTRIVVGGVPNIPGKTMPEKKAYLEENLDYVRTAIMLEPRGHNDMFGSIITQPTSEEADLGIIFMDGGGYLNMCGHGSIGAATVAVEEGMVEVTEPVTKITLEAPAGLVKANVKVENGKAKEVSIVNVPAFLYKRNVEVDVPGIGKVSMDISFGGSFFAIVKAENLGIEICPSNAQKIIEIGMKVIKAVNEQVEIQHPTLPHIKTVDLCEIYGPAKSADATLQNAVVFGQGQLDRSPCGTGTSAKLATLYAKGELKINEDFIYESILETKFRGRVLEETKVGDFDAIIPEITGSAFITGHNQFFIDPEDPVKHGFILK
ncbi:proline racemase [Clostridium carboxidivorans P7]|uniref:Proline racemase n=1 Tax=Clostridium carboxidivorans P7 TaxID=536227 RepID=C6PYC1_9CLOT|nr:proline racemase [Clostridium carboxidivorans]AKN33258.1 proline racemase [Clostridium carboxidivorans P7]EET85742.1 proline racemase [Clostridium carboxidivorans P7]